MEYIKLVLGYILWAIIYILDLVMGFIAKRVFPILLFILVYLYNMPTVWSN